MHSPKKLITVNAACCILNLSKKQIMEHPALSVRRGRLRFGHVWKLHLGMVRASIAKRYAMA